MIFISHKAEDAAGKADRDGSVFSNDKGFREMGRGRRKLLINESFLCNHGTKPR
jgi:hypothetical protein